MSRVLVLCALGAAGLTACSDYDFKPTDDGEETPETGTPDVPTDPEDTSDTDDSAWVDTNVGSEPVCGDPDDPGIGSVPLNKACEVELSTGSFTPIVEWQFGSAGFCGPASVGQTMDTNATGGIDDGDLPLVFIYQNNRVLALWGDGSGQAWQSSGTGYGTYGGMAIGDLDGDGFPEVVTADASHVCALRGTDGSQVWCATGLNASLDSYGYSYPSIADMDGDGFAEVTAGNTILDGRTGAVLGRGAFGKGAAPYGGSGSSTYGALSVPADLDGDGQLELVTGNAAYNMDGSTKWSNGGQDGIIAIADFDLDGQGEIFKTQGTLVMGMESDGTTAWGPITYTGNLSAPAADDMDGDGVPEIVFAAQNSLIVMEWGGAVNFTVPITDTSGAAGPVLFDFEMDGYPEILFADETTIRFFSGLDGSVKFTSNQHGSVTILETPTVADVDGDDQVEIILGHCNGGAVGSVTVFGDLDGTWPPGRKIWNQHAYFITNIGNSGEVPDPSTVANYADYNSFRSGDVGLPPSEYLDLEGEIIDVCDDECDTGVVYVTARVRNAGNVEAPANIAMSLRADPGGPVLATWYTPDPIPAGRTSEIYTFEVPAGDIAGARPSLKADERPDGSGVVYECEETNNEDTWGAPVCL